MIWGTKSWHNSSLARASAEVRAADNRACLLHALVQPVSPSFLISSLTKSDAIAGLSELSTWGGVWRHRRYCSDTETNRPSQGSAQLSHHEILGYSNVCFGYCEGGIWCMIQEVIYLPKARWRMDIEDWPQLLLPSKQMTRHNKSSMALVHPVFLSMILG